MRIGITGSIACGKSTVSSYLRSLGYAVVDADAISREMTADGGLAIPALKEAFPDCFTESGSLDRQKLGALVFSDSDARNRLNSILHPMILSGVMAEIEAYESMGGVVFADIPLLFECGMEHFFDKVWTVYLDEEQQIERLCARDNITREAALARIASQMSQREKRERADACINTSGTIEETRHAVDLLLAPYAVEIPYPRHRRTRQQSESTKASGTADASSSPERQSPAGSSGSPEDRSSDDRSEPAGNADPKPRQSLFKKASKPLNFVLLAIILIALLLSTVFGLRRFLAYEAEQKRLAAIEQEKAQHPLYYGDLILGYSARQHLNPALVSAVILCESSFDPKATSRVGARGLMQLMEDTAGWIAHKLGEDTADYSFDLMYEPEANIRFGTWYLGYLARRYNGDATKTICAYHAGQGNVDAWLRNPLYSQDGVTLIRIPTEDTARYANRVLSAMAVYEKYYFPLTTPTPELPDSAAATPIPELSKHTTEI